MEIIDFLEWIKIILLCIVVFCIIKHGIGKSTSVGQIIIRTLLWTPVVAINIGIAYIKGVENVSSLDWIILISSILLEIALIVTLFLHIDIAVRRDYGNIYKETGLLGDIDPAYFEKETTDKFTNNAPPRENGKEICEELRKGRIEFAKANDIPFEPAECSHEGPCAGTCHKCDEEAMYLVNEAEKRKQSGDLSEIKYPSMEK